VIDAPHEDREDGLIGSKEFDFLMLEADVLLLELDARHSGRDTGVLSATHFESIL